jgi:hypothetical protein
MARDVTPKLLGRPMRKAPGGIIPIVYWLHAGCIEVALYQWDGFWCWELYAHAQILRSGTCRERGMCTRAAARAIRSMATALTRLIGGAQ